MSVFYSKKADTKEINIHLVYEFLNAIFKGSINCVRSTGWKLSDFMVNLKIKLDIKILTKADVYLWARNEVPSMQYWALNALCKHIRSL